VARVSIDVMLKDEILDPQGQAIERALPELGFAGVADVRVGKHIELELPDGDDLEERVEAMARGLLANPVIESYTYRLHR
jgi:phosphoribosylformylglycinamidine synthase